MKRKITLKRETVRNLTIRELVDIRGGAENRVTGIPCDVPPPPPP